MSDDGDIKPEFPHDHKACLSDALAAAERICASRGARLTETRRRVLELIWSGHKAVKAYDLLEQLSADAPSVRPPTIYRALDFLLGQGLIHRIESMNAYVGCPAPLEGHVSQFLICRDCHTVIEMSGVEIDSIVNREAARHGFAPDNKTVEVHGHCARCGDGGA